MKTCLVLQCEKLKKRINYLKDIAKELFLISIYSLTKINFKHDVQCLKHVERRKFLRSIVNPFTTRFLRHKKRKIILHVWWAITRGNKSFSGCSNRIYGAIQGTLFYGRFPFMLYLHVRPLFFRTTLTFLRVLYFFRFAKRIATVSTNIISDSVHILSSSQFSFV